MEFDMLGFLVAGYFGLVEYARIYELPLMLPSVLLCASAEGLRALGRYSVLNTPVTRRDEA